MIKTRDETVKNTIIVSKIIMVISIIVLFFYVLKMFTKI